MGLCLSCCGFRPRNEVNNPRRNLEQRLRNWVATGIVSLRDANLKEVPSTVEQIVPHVKNLDLSNNKLRDLPPFVGKMAAMTRLLLIHNDFHAVPRMIQPLKDLRVLQLDQNFITELPPFIGELHRLEKLTVGDNAMKQLPNEIGLLTKLVQLFVGRNQLTALPDTLGQCVALEELQAQENKIESIPDTMAKLPKLRRINLDGNRVTALPDNLLAECQALQILALHRNPITPEVLHATAGFEEFERRRREKFDKMVQSGVLLGSGGLDEGIDRDTTRS